VENELRMRLRSKEEKEEGKEEIVLEAGGVL
jgi:hypothetical protein